MSDDGPSSQVSKFTPWGIVTEFVGESQVDSEATKRVLRHLAQLVLISPEGIIEDVMVYRQRQSYIEARWEEMQVKE